MEVMLATMMMMMKGAVVVMILSRQETASVPLKSNSGLCLSFFFAPNALCSLQTTSQ